MDMKQNEIASDPDKVLYMDLKKNDIACDPTYAELTPSEYEVISDGHEGHYVNVGSTATSDYE